MGKYLAEHRQRERERENPLANPIPADLRAVLFSTANSERGGECLDNICGGAALNMLNVAGG